MDNNYVDVETLYKLYFTSKLIILSKNEPTTPKKSIKKTTELITPLTKQILDTVSPRSKEWLLEDIKKDNRNLEKKKIQQDSNYTYYLEKMDNNGLGFFMENFISFYAVCPSCKHSSLKKYKYSNIPVVDLVCTNYKQHLKNNTCFIYQLKISLTDDYFDKQNQTIAIGSKKYGFISHEVEGNTELKNKLIIPGYICLKLRKSELLQEYKIEINKSFVLIPNYKNKINELYYNYINICNKYNKNVIQWNKKMVKEININEILNKFNIMYEIFSEEEIENPYKNIYL